MEKECLGPWTDISGATTYQPHLPPYRIGNEAPLYLRLVRSGFRVACQCLLPILHIGGGAVDGSSHSIHEAKYVGPLISLVIQTYYYN